MSYTPLRHSQNFLRSPQQVEQLLALSSITGEDVVYEIGPGKGAVTDQLVQHCRQVVAIEKDCGFAERLQCRYAAHPHVAIHAADFLEFPLPNEPYKVFANIPFNITHDIVTKLTSAAHPPQDAYLIMQQEAANKFCGIPREFLFSILLKPWFELDILYYFQRHDFIPSPQVDVVMLRMRKRGPPLIARHERQLFRDFMVHSFITRQPTLDQILHDVFTHRQRQQAKKLFSIDLDATPSAIPFPQWMQLFHYFTHISSAQARQLISGSEQRLHAHQKKLHKIHRTRVANRE